MYPQLRCFAACSGFHDIGPAPRNPQLILNLLPFVAAWLPYHNAQSTITSFACVRGCVATARRHSLLRLPFFCCASLHMSSYLKNMFFMSTCQKKHGFMSTCQKNMFFMSSYLKTCSSCLLVKKTWLYVFLSKITCSSCLLVKKNMTSCLLVKKNMASCPPCKYRTNGKKLLQNKNQF